MVILGIVAVGFVGALSGRAAVKIADNVLSLAEGAERISTHTMCGVNFECKNNHEYMLLEDSFKLITKIAEGIIEKAHLEQDDLIPMKHFITEGILLWGVSGMDICSVVLSKLQDESLEASVADAITSVIESLSCHQRQSLFLLQTLVA
jgi:hypothetical protein